ncbi:MAG TPA: nucleotidyltransferase family protein [Thermoanaerobaculia bacterium]|nr:nucleotidyltransferase family protein [Thermoanaerobaculia bacterium]
MDFIDVAPIAERLRQPLRAVLRGDRSDWPDLTPDETHALVVHGLAPLIYARARVPQLRSEAIRAAALEPARAAVLRELLGALARAGIAALVLKGSALAYGLYEAPELRPRGDTDLLVSASDVERARALFRELGFDEQPQSGDEHGLRQTVFTRAAGAGVVHMIDLHWAVANTPLFAATLEFGELLARAVAIPTLGEHARGLDDVDALLLACIHRVAHHHDSDRLIWLVDIALLRERMTRDAHARFWRAAAEGRIVGVCRRSIDLADAWMSRPPVHGAEEFLSREELERDEPSRLFLDRGLTRGALLAANLRALPWRARAARLWQIAFPPPEFLRQSFGARGNLVLPWLYVYRGVRGLLRLFRRVGA